MIDEKKAMQWARQRIIDRLEEAGAFVEASARLLVAVDTGNLRSSITHKVDEQELSVRIGTPVEYAPYLEFGTGELAENGKGRKGGWYYVDDKGVGHFTRGNKPQPFLRPALLNNKSTILKIMAL